MAKKRTGKLDTEHMYTLHDYSIHVPSRTLYMGSEKVYGHGESGVDALMAERQIKNIFILESLSYEPITIIMNNPGGDMSHGFAIYDALRMCKSPIIIKVIGDASSMGSIILQAGDMRYMSKNSRQLIHYGSMSVSSNVIDALSFSHDIKNINTKMENIYLTKIRKKHLNYKKSDLKKLLSHDTYLTAEQSLELNLIDSILEEHKT
jgi:ATP-dependent Clp endopeptidase proteolytic subunit ClpP